MKTNFINYAKSIRFKLINDRMSLNEALALFAILLLLSYLVIRILNPAVTVAY